MPTTQSQRESSNPSESWKRTSFLRKRKNLQEEDDENETGSRGERSGNVPKKEVGPKKFFDFPSSFEISNLNVKRDRWWDWSLYRCVWFAVRCVKDGGGGWPLVGGNDLVDSSDPICKKMQTKVRLNEKESKLFLVDQKKSPFTWGDSIWIDPFSMLEFVSIRNLRLNIHGDFWRNRNQHEIYSNKSKPVVFGEDVSLFCNQQRHRWFLQEWDKCDWFERSKLSHFLRLFGSKSRFFFKNNASNEASKNRRITQKESKGFKGRIKSHHPHWRTVER